MMEIQVWSSAETWGALYDPAMKVQTKEEADAYFTQLREYYIAKGTPSDGLDAMIKANLGYWAGYGSNEQRERIERLYDCAHLVFGRYNATVLKK